MRFARILLRRFHSLFRRSRIETDLQREIELHLEQLAKEHMAEGVIESEALDAAKREFGPVGLTKEECRDMRRVSFIEEPLRDLAFAVRVLRKSPIFTLTALLSLALGIGANTAIYSFMDAILMRALPIPDPQNLVISNWRAKGPSGVVHEEHGDGDAGMFPYPAFELLRNHNDVFSAIFGFADSGRLNLVIGNQAILGGGEYVSGNYFSTIGAPPTAGRLITDDDDHTGSSPVAVISYRVWQQGFNGAPSAVGQTILVNRKPFTVAGVTAPEFYGVNPRYSPDVFLPLHSVPYVDPRAKNGGDHWFHGSNNYWVEMMGRLRAGVTLRQAEALMAAQFHIFVADTASNEKERANLPELWLQEGGSGLTSLRRQYSKPLYILMGMTSLILAIACANLANLLLSRATARRREIAVRLSLGAGRWRIMRQLLTESVLLALLGGLMGLFVTAFGIRFLTSLLGAGQGQEDLTLHAGIDNRILLFAIFVSIITGVVFGLAPALQATKLDVTPALKESRASATHTRRFGLPFGLSHVLLTGQIALSLLLVIAAGLFVRTLGKLHSVSIGFNTQKLLLFNLDAERAGYERRSAIFYETLRQQFAILPGVRAATMTDIPLVAGPQSSTGISILGVPASTERRLGTNVAVVGPGFFNTMQIPILIGRPIGEQDTANAPRVVVVNAVFAKKFFPGRSSIGQHFKFDNTREVQIVGVARNSLYSSLKKEIPPVAYIPWAQPPPGWLIGGMYYEIRTVGDPLLLSNTIRQIVHQVNPLLPVADLATQAHYIDATLAPERTFADLCTCFGLLALLIACVGFYGTMAYAVARRTNEIGIRIALGAQRGSVIWLVQREVLVLSLTGLAIGLSVAWETARLVASFLFGVRPNDLVVFGVSAAILMTCTLAAGYAPAWRASRIDPMEALRHE